MPGNTVFTHEIDEIPLGIARQRRLAKMRVLTQISRRLNIKVRKVAATPTGHEDLAARLLSIINEQHPTAGLSCLCCTEHTCRASAYNNGIKPFHFTFLSKFRA